MAQYLSPSGTQQNLNVYLPKGVTETEKVRNWSAAFRGKTACCV